MDDMKIVFVAMLAMIYAGITYAVRMLFRSRRDETGGMKASRDRDAFALFTLAELAELTFPEVGVLDEPMCNICLDVVVPKQPARKLSCGHAFHAGCISSWWKCSLQSSHGKVSCPSCRTDLKVCSSVISGKKQQQQLLPREDSMSIFRV
ncbi:unnamed protein product [Polarella glacialis]|uniref:RING-type domain-containing protein n=1 Tax=Polarella glacialis TaxID=89957 RepID=A0A813KLY1_POLGL|nr:unnamed protein product [Polarella glacialis]